MTETTGRTDAIIVTSDTSLAGDMSFALQYAGFEIDQIRIAHSVDEAKELILRIGGQVYALLTAGSIDDKHSSLEDGIEIAKEGARQKISTILVLSNVAPIHDESERMGESKAGYINIDTGSHDIRRLIISALGAV